MGVLNQPPNMNKIIGDLDERIRALENSRRLTVPVVANYTKYPPYPQSGDLMVDASTGYLYVFITLVGAGYNGITSSTSAVIPTLAPVVSSSSITIGAGAKTFTTTNTGGLAIGDNVRVFQTSAGLNYMEGAITGLVANTSITVNVTVTSGSGTISDWGINALRTFTTTNTGWFRAGHSVRVFQTGSSTNYMEGNISSVVANTSITVNVAGVSGSGTYTSWSIRPFSAWRQVTTISDLAAANVYVSTAAGGGANTSLASLAAGGTGSGTTQTGGDGIIRTAGYAPIIVQ